jgi:tetratricopeptide (TPR) repeat protein
VECFETCLRGADPNDHRLLAQLYCNLGENLGVGARHSEALQHLERGLALRMRAFPDHWQTIGMAYALSWMAMVHADRGDFEAYAKHMEQAIGIIGPLSHGSALASINQIRAIAMAIRGDWDGALRYATVGRAVSNAIGAPTNHGMALCIEGFSRFMQSGSGAGVEGIETGIREMEAAGSRLALSLYLAFLAEVLARSADPERALEITERSLARAGDGDRLGEVAAHRARALALAAGDAVTRGEVEAELAAAEHLAAAKQSPREQALTDLLRAELSLRWSEREAASRCAARAARALDEMGMPWYRQRAEALVAEAGA